MATTATLVSAAPNRLRYLIEADGDGVGEVIIPTVGGATPDLLTDAPQGTIKKLAKVVADGFAGFALGVQTQAKSRALWLSDWSGANPAPGAPAGGFPSITTAIARLVNRDEAVTWAVDADVDGDGSPVLVVSQTSGGGGGCTDIVFTFSVVLIEGAEGSIGVNAVDCAIDVAIEQPEAGPQITWGEVKAELEAAGYTVVGGPADASEILAPPSTGEEAWVFEGTAECDDGLAIIAFVDIVNTAGAEPPADVESWLGAAGSFERSCVIGAEGSCYLDVFVPEAIG